jgi:HSP20 family protein
MVEMDIMRWEPFGDLVTLREAMNRLFDESWVRPRAGVQLPDVVHSAPIDMYQTDNEVVIEASLPGVKSEDVDISILGDLVTIRGNSKAETEVSEEDYFRREVRYGSVARELTLPVPVQASKAEATFNNGILTLRIPKAEEAKPKQIKVTAIDASKA